ncbi:contractile injection system tape measure protein [Paradesertivirga mongoliensis]|uniref:Contractile injection system tape measure protein n=1 Tax=Paradesertivirga mongoliensis TaxID=2100740 RepID=A0ABW4ZN86_9SPHI
MNFRKENTIQKQVVDFKINAAVDGFRFQSELEVLCRDDLKRALESLFEKYAFTDEVICLDAVFAEVEFISIEELKSSFSEKIVRELEKALVLKVSDAAKVSEITHTSLAHSLVKMLVFYLREGFFPWWSSVKTLQDWQEFVNVLCSGEVKPADWSPIFLTLREKRARKRLREVFTQQQIWKLIPRITTTSAESFERDLDTFLAAIQIQDKRQTFNDQYHDTLWFAIAEVNGLPSFRKRFADLLLKEIKQTHINLLQTIAPNRIETAELKERFIREREKNISPDKPRMPEVYFESQKQDENELFDEESEMTAIERSGEAIYIANSGLVLVAAFLPMFFKDLALLKDDVLDSDKAIAVLQYIVKGLDAYEEFETVLPKILCGLELSQPIIKTKISKMEKAKANDLLESVIEHWTVLKNTSVEGLRMSFLQREGRLSFQNNEWKLKVKQEAYDMLLSHLPWNISMIKLPWMKCLLNVEWA